MNESASQRIGESVTAVAAVGPIATRPEQW